MVRYLYAAIVLTLALVSVTGRVPALAGSWHLDVRNKSDKCVQFTAEHTAADLHGNKGSVLDRVVENIPPGKELNFGTHTYSPASGFAYANFYAKNCDGPFIEKRYDRFPSSGNSELSMHRFPNGAYIMRHGP